MIELIYACDLNGGIGFRGDLPWDHLPADMRWFSEKTRGKVVLMGSNTWFSLPGKLPQRFNVVLSSRDITELEGADLVVTGDDPFQIIDLIRNHYPDKDIVIIGGAQLYRDFYNLAERIHVTTVHDVYEVDTSFDMRSLMYASYKCVHEVKSLGDERFGTPDLLFQTFEKMIH